MSIINYCTSGNSDLYIERHSGPGAYGWLLTLTAQKLIAGSKIVIICNNTYTARVRLPLFFHQQETETREDAILSESLFTPTRRTAVFGSYSFAQVVGLALRYRKESAENLLNPFISTENFAFTPEEFLDLKERLDLAARKYANRPGGTTALDNLNTGFFRHQGLEECRSFLQDHLQNFLSRARLLMRQFLLAINGHARKAIFQRRGELAVRTFEIARLKDLLAETPNRKERKKRQAELRARWAEYQQKWNDLQPEPKAVPDLETVENEEAVVSEARGHLNRELAAASLSLSHLTVDPQLGDAAELERLAEKLDQLVQDVDEAGIYQLPLGGGEAATASRQLQRLDGVLQSLSTTYAHLSELDAFFEQRHFWYAQPARLRRLLAPLLNVPTEDWEAAFSGWYFDRCLERFASQSAQTTKSGELVKLIDLEYNDVPLPEEVRITGPEEAVPHGVDCIIDMTGGARPEGYSGEFYALASITDASACHHSLAGVLDARLTLLQSFVPNKPAAWSTVAGAEAPPGCNGRIVVQLSEAGEWLPLEEWQVGSSVEHLRMYIPREIIAACGSALSAVFDQLLLESERITIFHSWSQEQITQALLSDGANPVFLAGALLRAAEACSESPFEREALMAIGREIQVRCGIDQPVVHPLAEAMETILSQLLPDHFFSVHQPWRDTYLPLVVQAPSGRKTVLLPGGRLPGLATDFNEAARQQALRTAGMECLEIDAHACWEDPEREARRIVEFLHNQA